jgi:hypothetical protein
MRCSLSPSGGEGDQEGCPYLLRQKSTPESLVGEGEDGADTLALGGKLYAGEECAKVGEPCL